MRQYPFCIKKNVHFGTILDADMSIWMQPRFDGFDFFVTQLRIPSEKEYKKGKRDSLISFVELPFLI